MNNDNKIRMTSALAVALMLAVALGPSLFSEESEAESFVGTATLDIGRGMTWNWTPTFNLGEVELDLIGNVSKMPSTNTTFVIQSGNPATNLSKVEDDGSISVTITHEYAKSKYYLIIRATSHDPEQHAYYKITFNVANYELNYPYQEVRALSGAPIAELSPAVSGGKNVTEWTIDKPLPEGLVFNPANGKITGTPTAVSPQSEYTVTAVLDTNPTIAVDTVLSIGVSEPVDTSDMEVYAITGKTAITVPGFSVNGSVTVSATKDGSAVSVAPGTAYNGMTVSATDGEVTGTPTEAGVYVFRESLTVDGNTVSRNVTVTVEDQVTTSWTRYVYGVTGTASTYHVDKTSGPANVTWLIRKMIHNGERVGDVDYSLTEEQLRPYGISVDSSGNLKTSAATPVGTYKITLYAQSANEATSSAGTTGSSPAQNVDKPYFVLVVKPMLGFTNTPTADCEITEADL